MSESLMPATVASGMDATETDEALMLRYRDGDAEAFSVLYERHKGALYRYFLRQCPTSAITEELFQDVWMNLVRSHSPKFALLALFPMLSYGHWSVGDNNRSAGYAPIETDRS